MVKSSLNFQMLRLFASFLTTIKFTLIFNLCLPYFALYFCLYNFPDFKFLLKLNHLILVIITSFPILLTLIKTFVNHKVQGLSSVRFFVFYSNVPLVVSWFYIFFLKKYFLMKQLFLLGLKKDAFLMSNAISSKTWTDTSL